jgi:phosphatidylserine decarboxylase
MLSFLHNNLLWSEGQMIVAVLCAIALVGLHMSRFLLYSAALLFFLTLYFFRNPDRACTEYVAGKPVLVCPADGKIVDIAFDQLNGFAGYAQRVSIFLSPLDVHVTWSPIAGKVMRVVYKPGAFTFAFLPKSSELNERNDITLQDEQGRSVMVRQIAGTVARRICCFAHEESLVHAGDKIGLIRFGSRVDIFLPAQVKLAVGLGQRVFGGQSVLGYWS